MVYLVSFSQLIAQSDADKWLEEHPQVLGLIAILIGALLAGWGVVEFRSGVARDKYGNEIDGAAGKGLALVRILFGVAACGFGLYKMFS